MVELYDIKALSEKVTRGELTAHEAAAQIETTSEMLEDFYARFSPAAAEIVAEEAAAYHAIMCVCFTLHPKEKQPSPQIPISSKSRPKLKYYGNRDEREDDEREERGGPLRYR